MKFTAVTLACLATGALAEPLGKLYARDLATIKGAIDAVGQDLEKVDEAVKSFSGSPKPVQDASEKLVSTIKASQGKVESSSKLTLVDAVGLQAPVEGLTSKGEALAGTLKSRKSDIQKGGYCRLVRGQVNDIDSESNKLVKAVVDKVPTEAQGIAAGLASKLQKVLADTKSEFSEGNCKDSAPKPSEPASSAPASSAPASSAPASSEPASSAEPSEPASSAEPSEPAETSAPASSGYPVPSKSVSEPATTPYQPTGTGVPTGYPTNSQVPIVTAGAALVAPAGALAMAVAAMML